MRLGVFLATLVVLPFSVVTAIPVAAQSGNQNLGNQNQNSVAQNVQNDKNAAAPHPPAPLVVEVRPGDSLTKIAEEHASTYPRLYAANPAVEDPDVIFPGQKLRVPRPDEALPDRPLPVKQAPAPSPTVRVPVQVSPRASYYRSPAAAPTAAAGGAAPSGGVWDRLAACESGGNWSINTGNGYYGGLQFTPGSWRAAGGSGLPHQASREEQIQRAQILQQRQGWGAWPACTSKLGIR